MGARLRVAISPADVGRRVTVRARTHAGHGEPAYTDTVGVLLSWDDDGLQIRRRTGEIVTLPASDLVAARVVEFSPRRSHR